MKQLSSGSLLVNTSVKNLQNRINSAVKSFKNSFGIYICLNKTQKSTEDSLKKAGIKIDKLFFIDCIASKKIRNDVLYISPNKLKLLNSAVNSFIKDVDGKKFLMIDALSTLLIYNDETQVAEFVEKIIETTSKNNVKTAIFSPNHKNTELINKISHLFDKVIKK